VEVVSVTRRVYVRVAGMLAGEELPIALCTSTGNQS